MNKAWEVNRGQTVFICAVNLNQIKFEIVTIKSGEVVVVRKCWPCVFSNH